MIILRTDLRLLVPALTLLTAVAACGGSRAIDLWWADVGATRTDAGTPGGDGGRDVGVFDPTVYVNPFIGTDGNGAWGTGSTLPGPMAPWGMVKPGPDSSSPDPLVPPQNTHCGGYYYRDEYITAFSQNHFSGTGVPDYGNIGLMPRLGRDTAALADTEYLSRYKKETESAAPAYYAVTLASGINVEITASDRAAFHRYTFPTGYAGDRCVIIDLGHTIPAGVVTATGLTFGDEGVFDGHLHSYGGETVMFDGYSVYFRGEVSPVPASTGTWNAERMFNDGARDCGGGKACGALVCWPNAGRAEVKIALSYVSAAKARANFAAEAEGKTFDEVRAATREKWRRLLARFEIEGASADDLAVFYTALYHVFSMPTLMSDADGSYLGFDGKPHTVDWGADSSYYSDFSLWDTYRTEHPFLTLFYRGQQRDFVHSLLSQGRTGGYFPRIAVANGETNDMVGTPADVVVADSFLKGIDFPAAEAFDIALRTALHPTEPGSGHTGREGVEDYLALGYVPSDRYSGSVSKTQEYAFADSALCAMAQGLGRAEAETLCRSRENHRNLWDARHLFFLARDSSGAFPGDTTFDPEAVSADTEAASNRAYIEGNAWQYRWFAPHDTAWLLDSFGGAGAFAQELAAFFEKSKAEADALVRGTAAWGSPRRFYWQGNEPDIHNAWLFSAAGHADLTCRWVRWAMRTNFVNSPDGLPGNDDAGTMSAWYLFSALGFYPVPGTDLYYLGCPFFPRTKVSLDNGTLLIVADGPLDDSARPQRMLWNGAVLQRPELTWGQIKDGGELRFEMGE